MSAPDELAEMKLWTPCLHDMWRATETDPQLLDASKLYYARDEVDRVIAAMTRERDLAKCAHSDMAEMYREATRQVASRDAQLSEMHADWHKSEDENAKLRVEIGRLRERVDSAERYTQAVNSVNPANYEFTGDYLDMIEKALAALTPPSQAPEARRDVGGEKPATHNQESVK